jgi:hypothetical protein
MKAQAAGLSAQRRGAAAKLGPAKYLAAILGVPADDTLRWFVLLVACLFDPAAKGKAKRASVLRTSIRRGSMSVMPPAKHDTLG